jgi:hypothetical protein
MGVDGYFTKEETFDEIRNGYFLNPDDMIQNYGKENV